MLFFCRSETPVLYHIIPEKRTDHIGNSMMASTHVYDMAAVSQPAQGGARRGADKEGMVELALDPSELDLDSDAMAVRYEQQMRENQSQLQKEDLSDMLAEHVAKQKVNFIYDSAISVLINVFFRIRGRGNNNKIQSKRRNIKNSNFKRLKWIFHEMYLKNLYFVI